MSLKTYLILLSNFPDRVQFLVSQLCSFCHGTLIYDVNDSKKRTAIRHPYFPVVRGFVFLPSLSCDNLPFPGGWNIGKATTAGVAQCNTTTPAKAAGVES